MSLHCAARLFVARHGDATYEGPRVWSDQGGRLSDLGHRQALDLAERLRGQRIAAVYSSTMGRAVETAQVAADVLGVVAHSEPGLEEFRVGDFAGRPVSEKGLWEIADRWVAGEIDLRVPGGESGREVLARMQAALQDIADLHRGEQVLVISHGGVMSLALPRLCRGSADDLARGQYLPNAAPAELTIGDDGWELVSWPGTSDPARV